MEGHLANLCYLQHLLTAESARNQGIGRALIGRLFDPIGAREYLLPAVVSCSVGLLVSEALFGAAAPCKEPVSRQEVPMLDSSIVAQHTPT